MPVIKKHLIKLAALGVRFAPAERAALKKAAQDDARPVSVLARKIVVDWLREKGYLK